VKSLEESKDGPIEKEINIGSRDDPADVKKKTVYQGYLYRHGKVPANPLSSTCHEQTRKHATLSQNVVAINQALNCHSDLGLLRGAIANTADLLFTARLHRPDLFQEDELFVQMAAVAQSFPFALDLKALDGALVAGTGTYDDGGGDRPARNRVADVQAALKIKLIMRGLLRPGDEDLRRCQTAVEQLFPAIHQMLIDKKRAAVEAGNETRGDELCGIRKQFKKCRLILQVNIHSTSGDKYAFVTNLKQGVADNEKVLFRNITRNNALVNSDKIAAVRAEIEELSTNDPKASEYFDFILAKAKPSAELLKLDQFYRPWGEKLLQHRNKDL